MILNFVDCSGRQEVRSLNLDFVKLSMLIKTVRVTTERIILGSPPTKKQRRKMDTLTRQELKYISIQKMSKWVSIYRYDTKPAKQSWNFKSSITCCV